MSGGRTPDREAVMEHAELTALYFRRLVDEGVPLTSAMSLAGRYGEGLVLAWVAGEKPAEPWSDPPP